MAEVQARVDHVLASNRFAATMPGVVVSGAGCFSKVGELLDEMGVRRAVVVTNRSLAAGSPLLGELGSQLGSRLVGSSDACREHSPGSSVDSVAQLLVRSDADGVVGIGGGSVCDAVKAATVLAASDGRPVTHVAVPTTLSGAEFTTGIGLTDEKTHRKTVSVDRQALPSAVVLDPTVTAWTPWELWASTGIKAVDHAVEAIWCRQPHPLMSVLAAEGLGRLAASLPASRDVHHLEVRADCQYGAWMAIVRPGRSAVRLSHIAAHQVGSCWSVPHGLTSCVLLPAVMRYLAPATQVAHLAIGSALGLPPSTDPAEAAERAAEAIEQLIAGLGLPVRLRDVVPRDGMAIEEVAAAVWEEACQLRCTADLPDGTESVLEVLRLAW